MTPAPHDRLTPEERALAARLSRIGPHGEPSTALDARILAAAHAAVAGTPPRRRRWPVAMGVAATLALAIGVTWQLRPTPDAMPGLEEGPVAAADAVQAPAAEAAPTRSAAARDVATEPFDTPASGTSSPPASAPAIGMPPATADVRPATKPLKPAKVKAIPPPAEEPPSTSDAIDMEQVQASPAFSPVPPPPPAPPAPPAAPAPAPAAVMAAPTRAFTADTQNVTGASAVQRKASPQPQSTAEAAAAMDGASKTESRTLRDMPVEEDARLPADAWLDRIRQRMHADDLSGARDSLALFRRHHPDRAIPEDLAALAQ